MPVLNCSRFEQQLRESVESQKPPEAAVYQHSTECDKCRRLWEEYVLLERAIADWRTEQTSPDLVDAVLAQHAFDHPEISPATVTSASEGRTRTTSPATLRVGSPSRVPSDQVRRRNGILAVIASAALILFVVLNPLGQLTTESPPASDMSFVSTDDRTQTDVPEADVQTVVRDAGSAYLSLARDAAGVFSDTVVLIPEPVRAPLGGESNSDDAVKLPEWDKEFDPIRRDVNHAIDFLFDVISADPEPAA